MKVRTKESGADWVVTLKVTDREAKKRNKKNVVYDYAGELRTDGITYEIMNQLQKAQVESYKWKKTV